MKRIKLNKISIISLALAFLVVILLVANALTGNKIVGPIYRAIANRLQGIDIDSVMSYVVYDNSQYYDNDADTNRIKVLLEFNNENGIEYIKSPHGNTINGNGKSKVAVDWTTSYSMNEKFIVKLKDQAEIEKFLNITQEDVNNQFEINVEETSNGYINKVNYAFKKNGDTNSYKIGDNFWTNYNPDNMIVDYTKTRTDPVSLYEGNANIDLKKTDSNGNTVYANLTTKVYSNKIYYFFHVKRLGNAGAGLTYSLQGGKADENYATFNTYDAKLGAGHGSGSGGYTADIEINVSKLCESIDISNAKNVIANTHLAAYNGNSYSYANMTTYYSDGSTVTSTNQGFNANNERDFSFSIKTPVTYNINKIKLHFWGQDASNSWAGGWLTSLNFEIGEKDLKTITYDANGGTGEIPATIDQVPKVSKNLFTAPEGKGFVKWNTKANGRGTSYRIGTVLDHDEKLYAIWGTIVPAGELEEGTHVMYNGEEYVVLYQYKDHATKYTTANGYSADYGSNGVHIVSLDALGSCTLGSGNWNSAVSNLNSNAAQYKKSEDTTVTARCIGSDPLNPSSQSGNTDTNYQPDVNQLGKFNIKTIPTTSYNGYWLASRYLRNGSGGPGTYTTERYIRAINNSGALENNLVYYYYTYTGNTTTYNVTRGIRPVMILPADYQITRIDLKKPVNVNINYSNWTTYIENLTSTPCVDSIRIPDKLFDNSNEGEAHCWHSASSAQVSNPVHVTIELKDRAIVNDFTITNRNSTSAINDFKLQGSNDGENYTDLGDFVQNTSVNYSQNHIVSYDYEDDGFKYYRIYITSSSGYAVIGELSMNVEY